MAPVIWSQQDIDTLKSAIASGIMTVSFSGPPARTITYQSLDAMRSLLVMMLRDVNGAGGTYYIQTSKGL